MTMEPPVNYALSNKKEFSKSVHASSSNQRTYIKKINKYSDESSSFLEVVKNSVRRDSRQKSTKTQQSWYFFVGDYIH